MDNVFCGTIKLDEIEHFFSYSDKILLIHPDQKINKFFENVFTMNNNNETQYKCLVGMTYDRHLIYFIDVKLVKQLGDEYYGYPKAYIIFDCNTLPWDYDVFKFNTILLKSNTINSLQNIEYANKVRESFFENDHLKQKDITTEFNIKNGNGKLKTGLIIHNQNHDFPIEVTSTLEISLMKEITGYDIYILANKINEVFKFIFNRENISFSNIDLVTEKIPVQDFISEEIAHEQLRGTLKFLYHNNEFEGRDISKVKEPILKNFKYLFESINRNIINYYPKNDNDFRYVDIQYFIKVCGTFEREFDLCYPEWIETNEPEYIFIRDNLLRCLTDLDEQFKGNDSSIRSKISSFKNTVINMNERLEKRLNYAFDKYAYCLEPRFKKYCISYELKNINFSIIASKFANKRNKYVHTFKALGFNKEEIVGFIIVRELIYCMILEQSKFTKNEIAEMISLYK